MRRWSLGISLFLHGVGALVLVRAARVPLTTPEGFVARPGDRSLEVRAVAPRDLDRELREALEDGESAKRIVQTDERLRSPAPPRDEKAALSKVNQSVDRETRAAKIGKFRNVENEGGDAAARVAKLFELPRHDLDLEQDRALDSKTGVVKTLPRQPAALPPSRLGGDGESATDDYLPHVAVGAKTMLNTREFKYYGFFERIREKLAHRWQNRVQAASASLDRKSAPIQAAEHVTKVQVTLDKSGALKGVQLLASSGVEGFDRAAREAFEAAAPFPNPPKEMLEANGSLSIRWDFVVVAQESGGLEIRVRRR